MTRLRSFIFLLVAPMLLNCQRGDSSSSSLTDASSRNTELDSLYFSHACARAFQEDSLNGAPEQKEVVIKTINLLFAKYKKLMEPQQVQGTARDHCETLSIAWKDRKLDLSGSAPLSVMMVVKLNGVKELDLSDNKLTDEDMRFIRSPINSTIENQINLSLIGLDLAHNAITATGDMARILDLKNTHTKLQKLDLSDNQIKSVESLTLPNSLYALDLSYNKELEIGPEAPWDSSFSMTTLSVKGIKSFDMASALKIGMRDLAIIHASNVAKVSSQTLCGPGRSFQNLIHLSLKGSTVDSSVSSWFADTSCMPSMGKVDLAESNVIDLQEQVDALFGIESFSQSPASCSTKISTAIDTTGRIQSVRCEGALQFQTLGIDEDATVYRFDANYPQYL